MIEDLRALAEALADVAAAYFDRTDDAEFIANFTKDCTARLLRVRLDTVRECADTAKSCARPDVNISWDAAVTECRKRILALLPPEQP